MKIKMTKKLVSADNHSNVFNHKYTYLMEMVPLCKVKPGLNRLGLLRVRVEEGRPSRPPV